MNSGLAPPENYPADEKRILLRVAGQIRAARGRSLDELMAVTAGLGSTVQALRKVYGPYAVEANCPAEQLIRGIMAPDGTREKERANKLYDDLVNDLHAFAGDEMRTWMRMAWMLNPSMLEGASKDIASVERPQGPAMRERVAAALKTVGVTAEEGKDDNEFCIFAAWNIARAVMKRVGADPQTYDDDNAFVAGLFASVASDLLTQKIGGAFEIVGMVAITLVISPFSANPTNAEMKRMTAVMAEFTRHVLDAHNSNQRTVHAIGETILSWINNPNEANLSRLAELFVAARQQVRTQS